MSGEAENTAGERVCGYPEHEHQGWPEDENGDSTPVGCAVCPPAPAEPDAGDVEALAKVLHAQHDGNRCIHWTTGAFCERWAQTILASDWLAARDAATADRARREGAAEALGVVAIHRLHPSMNICTGCDWRATPDAGSLKVQHWAHVEDRVARIARSTP